MKLLRITFVICLLVSPLWAQEQTPVFKLNVDVDLVELHVSVVDEKDRAVAGLQKENFRILEDRVNQPIAVFKHEDVPVSLGLVIDNSRSIEPRKRRLDAAALAFVQKSNPEDEAFIVHFDFDARVAQRFTDDEKQLEAVLAGVKPFGQTALYDALIVAIDEMEKARYTKKAILLITDGLDNVSKHTLAEAIERIRQARVAVYPVGLLSAAEGERGETELLKIAEASGGKAYFPMNEDEARNMMERIARDLREQYTLAYAPDANRDGAWHSVRVEIIPPPGYPQRLIANYRHGYYGPGPRN
jgi:Ca-activated chloride channel family protein